MTSQNEDPFEIIFTEFKSIVDKSTKTIDENSQVLSHSFSLIRDLEMTLSQAANAEAKTSKSIAEKLETARQAVLNLETLQSRQSELTNQLLKDYKLKDDVTQKKARKLGFWVKYLSIFILCVSFLFGGFFLGNYFSNVFNLVEIDYHNCEDFGYTLFNYDADDTKLLCSIIIWDER